VELTEPMVRTIECGTCQCIATVEAAPGSALCVALDEVAEVRPSRKSFEYFQQAWSELSAPSVALVS